VNNYQTQQFDSIIDFMIPVIFIGFTVGMIRNFFPGKTDLLHQSKKISDYELTIKGKDYAREYDAKLHGQYTRYEVLETIWFQSKPSKGVITNAIKFIPELKELGYIHHVDYTVNELIGEIENPTMKRILTVYSRFVRQLPVRGYAIDWVHDTLVDEFYGFSLRKYPKEQLAPVQRALLEAETRSEKRIAIDSTLSITHDTGYYLEVSGAEKNYAVIGRILNKLAGE